MPCKPRSIEDRFWSKVDKTSSPNGCWLFTRAKNKGYGVLQVGTHDKPRTKTAPRIAWELLRGPIPKGFHVLHNCPGGDNKACCNPYHCFLGKEKEHAADKEAKGQYNHPIGTANGGAKLNPDKVREARRLRALGYSCRAIAEIIGGVVGQTIYEIFRGKTWTQVK